MRSVCPKSVRTPPLEQLVGRADEHTGCCLLADQFGDLSKRLAKGFFGALEKGAADAKKNLDGEN